jgi:hypothetical protein
MPAANAASLIRSLLSIVCSHYWRVLEPNFEQWPAIALRPESAMAPKSCG